VDAAAEDAAAEDAAVRRWTVAVACATVN